jgi:acyl carrier protein
LSETIEQKLKPLLARVMRVDAGAITAEASTDTIATWDSLNHMKLILALEEEFDIALDEGQIEQMTSVPKIIAVIGQAKT